MITIQHLTDIANAIRGKLDVQTKYKPAEMAAAIKSISTKAEIVPSPFFPAQESIVDDSLEELTGATGAPLCCATGVKSVSLKKLKSIKVDNSFYRCASLTSLDLPQLATVSGDRRYLFSGCSNLVSLRVKGGDKATIPTSGTPGIASPANVIFTADTLTPVAFFTGLFKSISPTTKIYVADALYDTYQNDSSWAAYKSQIVKASTYKEATS